MDISNLARRLGKELNRHAPLILTGLGTAGIAATAYFFNRAGFRSAERIIHHEIMMGETSTQPKEVVQLTWRNYILPTSIGMFTVACIITASAISTKRQTALLGAVALSERALSLYREKMEENLTPEVEKKVREQLAVDAIENTPLPDDGLVDIPMNREIFLDKFTGQYFGSDVDIVREAMTKINEKTIEEGYASMNDFFALIGARRTDIGVIMGWTEDRMLDIDLFPLETKDGRPCIVIDYRRQPVMEYHRVY